VDWTVGLKMLHQIAREIIRNKLVRDVRELRRAFRPIPWRNEWKLKKNLTK